NEEEAQKDKKTTDWILECVKDNLLFLKLDREQRERVVKRMRLVKVPTGTAIITQGEVNANTFYVCESGSFDILVDKVKVGQYKRGGCFGELALLYDSPRAATITATSDSEVWEVSRNAFRYEVAAAYKQKNVETINFLKKVELFSFVLNKKKKSWNKPLLNSEITLAADALMEITFTTGQVVIKEGDEGDKFYIIKKGMCQWSKSNGEKGELSEGMFFGERALRTKEKRAATITALSSELLLLAMTAKDFEGLLGPVIEIIDGRISQYKRMAEEFEKEQKEAQSPKDTKDTPSGEQEKPSEEENIAAKRDKVCGLKELVTIGLLGKGAFGYVSLVEDPKTKKSYALKAIKKCQIVELGQQAHIISEKRVMEKMFNQFLVNLHRTYKDKLRVYFLLDACLGGELFTILRHKRYFDENTARFFTACVGNKFFFF
ncbi:protein kinase, partial [Reticulomyxa filosa]